jgi:hypothetical protein
MFAAPDVASLNCVSARQRGSAAARRRYGVWKYIFMVSKSKVTAQGLRKSWPTMPSRHTARKARRIRRQF